MCHHGLTSQLSTTSATHCRIIQLINQPVVYKIQIGDESSTFDGVHSANDLATHACLICSCVHINM